MRPLRDTRTLFPGRRHLYVIPFFSPPVRFQHIPSDCIEFHIMTTTTDCGHKKKLRVLINTGFKFILDLIHRTLTSYAFACIFRIDTRGYRCITRNSHHCKIRV